MKIVNRMFLKIKVRGNKIFSIVSIFAILANSFAPVLAAIPTYTYAEGITAPVEALTKEDKEEIKVEEKVGSESVLKEEKNTPENLKNEEDKNVNGTESQTSEEVSEENQEGDILEDGVSDYRPEVEITEDEVKEVEEVSVLKETVNPANEINSNEEVTEATASAEEPVLENKEKEYKYLENGVVVDSTREDWSVDGEVAETKKVVKIGVKYIFPLDEDVSVTFTKLPKSEEDRAHLKIERVKIKDLNLPDEFKTDAEYAFDITTEGMENGEFEYDLTLPKPKGVEAKVISIEEDGDIVEASDDDIDQKEEIVEVKDQSHFSIKVPVYSLGKWTWVDKPEILVKDTLGTSYIKWDKGSEKHSGLEFIGKQTFDVDIDGEQEFELGTLKHHNFPVYNAIEKAKLSVTITLGDPIPQTKVFNMELRVEETPNSGTCAPWHTQGNPKCDDRITFPTVYSKEFFEIGETKYVLEITGFIKDGQNVTQFITKEEDTNEAIIRGRLRSIPAKVTICDRTDSDENPYVVHTPSVDGIWTDGHDGHNGPIWYPGLKDLETKWGDIIPEFRYFDSQGNVRVYPGKNNTAYGLSILENDCKFPEGKITVNKVVIPEGDATSFGIVGSGTPKVADSPVTFKEGNNTGTISATTPATFDVYPGTYSFTENPEEGWIEVANDCNDIQVANGDEKSCIIKNAKASSITIIKHAEQVSDTSFDFTATGTGLSNFSLVDNSTSTDPEKVFTNLLPGNYSITENSKEGWYLKSATCNNDQSPDALTLTAGSNVTCTFTNTQQGSLTIVKKALPFGTDSFGFTLTGKGVDEQFNLVDNSDTEDASETFSLKAGTYAVVEDNYSDWKTTYSCTGNNTIDNIVLEAGKSVTCTFTNTKYGSISGRKLHDLDGLASTTNDRKPVQGYTIFIDTNKDGKLDPGEKSTTTAIDGSYSFTGLEPGEYTVVEVMKLGWIVLPGTSTSWTIKLSPGENRKGVDFINIEKPTIEVIKFVDIDGDGKVDVEYATDWTWKLDDKEYKMFGKEDKPMEILPGTYTISEIQKDGYHVKSMMCDNGGVKFFEEPTESTKLTINSGDKILCRFTNTRDTGTLIVRKEVINDNGGTAGIKEFGIKLNDKIIEDFDGGTTVDTKTTYTANLVVRSNTEYSLSEEDLPGYEEGSWNCIDNEQNTVTMPFKLSGGQHVTCTITNTYIVPACIEGEGIGVGKVGSVKPGTRYDGTPIVNLGSEDRTKPGNALGTADDKFYSLGKDGEIVLEFTGYVENVEGNDFSIHEVTWNRNDDLEENAEVYVRKDNTSDWVYLGEASSFSDGDGDGTKDGITHFDFGSKGLPWITAVKLVESSEGQKGYDDGFDLNAVIAVNHVCEEPSVSQVEICKVDNKNRPQEGWDVVLASEKVDGPTSINVIDGSGTNSTSLHAGKYLIKVSGTYRYGNSLMIADAGYSFRPKGIPSGCDCWLDGHEISNGLMALVNGNAVSWGAYNKGHVYTYVYNHSSAGAINISISDNIYGDNVNNNFQFEIFRIPEGYYGTTGENGCVTLDNILYGDYVLDEILKQGWINVSGKGSLVSVDSPKETFTLVNRINAPVTIVATKIVCDYEEDLPDWGYGAPDNITKDTASEFLASHSNCSLEPNWSFQWGDDSSTNPGDDHVGEADGWNTFGPTDINGVATVNINDFGTTSQIKVREVLQENYIPFTYLINGNNLNDVSAEIYCHTDVLNYDNDDRFTPEYGQTYYCVAWNVQIDQKPTIEVSKEADKTSVDETGENVTFTFTVKNTSKIDTVEILSLEDSVFGTLEGDDDCKVGAFLAPNESCSFDLTKTVESDASGDAHKNIFTAKVKDKEGNETSDDDDHIIEFTDVLPTIEIKKTADPAEVPETGADVTFKFVVKNTGLESVTITSLEDSVFGTLEGDDDCKVGTVLPGKTSCEFSITKEIKGDASEGDHYNVFTATAKDNEGNEASGKEGETVDLLAIPELSISKSNDSYPTAEKIGNQVRFTIKVTAHRNDVNEVEVYDLFSKGFKYVGGSWTADSNVRGDLKLLGITPEPAYASPASWDLGDMKKDEVVTLTYLAEITDSVIAGVYKDLAWTQGKTTFSGEDVLGYAEETGYVNDSFVGTQVRVEVDPPELKDKISIKEKKVEGEVLGASTLPATGSRTLWVKIVLALLAIGGTLMILGTLDLDKNSNKKGNKKSVKKSLIGLFVLSLFIALSRGVYAASTVVRLSEPKPPVTKEFNLVFVAMDVQDREIVAKCFYKFGDSSYSQFGSDITILSGESGDSRTCFVDKNVLDSDGKYTFKVEATAGGTTVSSNEVVINYDGEGPGKPEYIKKEKVNDCVNKITLKTSNDGETKYVKVYADDDKEIDIKDSNLIETEDLGPDKKFSFEHIVSGDACKKDWYYAVVAFDSADNASNPRSETITKVTETTSKTEEVAEAIPVVGGAGIAGEGGVVAGDQEVATTEGEEAQGTTEEDGSTLEGNEEEGSVLGEQTEKKSAFKSPWLWVVLVGLGIIIVSSVKKGKKN